MSGWFRWAVLLAVLWVLVSDSEPPQEAARAKRNARVTVEESLSGPATVDHRWREPADLRPGTHGVVVSTWTTDKEDSALDAEVQVRLIPADRNVDAVFVIDTTSSMSWIFETARSKALEMVKALEASREDGKDVRAGLIEYRDRGDRFRGTRDHIRLSELTSDWEGLRGDFERMRASGGGDMPEDVQGALLQGLERLDWRRDSDTTRVIFLIGDAPAQKYADQPGVPALGERLAREGFTLHAFCAGMGIPGLERLGISSPAEADFKALSGATGGSYEVIRKVERTR
jgi:hypothetical protein